jgi:hypothetical protein
MAAQTDVAISMFMESTRSTVPIRFLINPVKHEIEKTKVHFFQQVAILINVKLYERARKHLLAIAKYPIKS